MHRCGEKNKWFLLGAVIFCSLYSVTTSVLLEGFYVSFCHERWHFSKCHRLKVVVSCQWDMLPFSEAPLIYILKAELSLINAALQTPLPKYRNSSVLSVSARLLSSTSKLSPSCTLIIFSATTVPSLSNFLILWQTTLPPTLCVLSFLSVQPLTWVKRPAEQKKDDVGACLGSLRWVGKLTGIVCGNPHSQQYVASDG